MQLNKFLMLFEISIISFPKKYRHKNPKETKEQLSQLVEEERQRKRITGREYMVDHDHDGYDDYDDDQHYH